jgi:hypothetical protein
MNESSCILSHNRKDHTSSSILAQMFSVSANGAKGIFMI